MLTRPMLIAKREVASYLTRPLGWTLLAVVLALVGVLFNAVSMHRRLPTSEVLSQFFYFSTGVTMVTSIFLSMRTFAAEREHGTLVLLTTSPLSPWQLVLGKFLGAWSMLAITVLATAYIPLLVAVNGHVSLGQVVAGYTGLLLLGACTTAMGVFASSFARSQLLAGVVATAIVVVFLISWQLAKAVDPPLASVFSYAALFDTHFRPFMTGAVHLKSIVFYLSVATLFLLAAVRVLDARRWR